MVHTTVTIDAGSVDGYEKDILLKTPTLEPTSELSADSLPKKLTRPKVLVKPGGAADAPQKTLRKEKPKLARFAMR